MNLDLNSLPLGSLAAVGIPGLYAGLALLPGAGGLRRTQWAAGTALIWTLALLAEPHLAARLSAGPLANPTLPLSLHLLLHVDGLAAVMLILVSLLGWVIARYSAHYLDGESGRPRFERALLSVLACVSALVLARDLALIVVLWFCTGQGLHALLTFYPQRAEAQRVAHKKFMVSRLADSLLIAATVLVTMSTGSSDLDQLSASVSRGGPLPLALHGAAALIVLSVALRSAQVPFHGWMIQVMEAPTPVSALLHAGIVNLGGFVLLRVAPLIDHAPLARALLVLVGTASVVSAGLVTMTRVSIKVALAWSTCAQLGFMLVECGLGAWSLAFLHLLGHSLYKAHAFLRSGSVVTRFQLQAMAGPPPTLTTMSLLRGLLLSSAGLGLLIVISARLLPGFAVISPWLIVLGLVLGLAMAGPIAAGHFRSAIFGGLFAVSYLAGHGLVERMLPGRVDAGPLLWSLALAGLLSLWLLQAALRLRPQGRLACALWPHLFAGLYLDALCTRLMFSLWPPPRALAPEPATATPAPLPQTT